MDVIDRLKKKDENALIELMAQYGDYLLRTAFLLIKDIQMAEEIVQDTFVIAFGKIAQLNDSGKLKSWLTTIVINQCRARMRRWSWKSILLKFNENDFETKLQEMNIQDEELPENFTIKANESQYLYESIQQLDYKYREVITLFYFNELSIADMVVFLNENENTIKTRLRRGRNRLKQLLEEGGMNDVG